MKLWDHQKEVISLGIAQDNFALFHEMGTGKTCSAIQIMRLRFTENQRILRTLILAPKSVLTNWKREITKFSKTNPKDILVLDGNGTKRVKTLSEFIQNKVTDKFELNKIVILNYEALLSDDIFDILALWKPELIVADESHLIKNYQSKRAKALVKIGDNARYRYIMTGSPILQDEQDLYMQFRFLDKGATFGTNYFKFRSEWFADENSAWANKQQHFPKYSIKKHRVQDFNKLIYQKAHRVLKKDCLSLPDLVRQVVEVELSPEQTRMYNEMKKEFITFIQNEKDSGKPLAVVAQLAVTKALRLQQIASGFCTTDEGLEVEIKNSRIEVLKDLVEQLTPNNKVIIWAKWQSNQFAIHGMLKKMDVKHTMLTGTQDAKEKQEAMDNFENDPSVRVIVASQSAGGTGVNLVQASYAIYYSKGFALGEDLQSEARNYRGGSEIHEKITRIDIVAKGTIDEQVNEALEKKMDISKNIIDLKL